MPKLNNFENSHTPLRYHDIFDISGEGNFFVTTTCICCCIIGSGSLGNDGHRANFYAANCSSIGGRGFTACDRRFRFAYYHAYTSKN